MPQPWPAKPNLEMLPWPLEYPLPSEDEVPDVLTIVMTAVDLLVDELKDVLVLVAGDWGVVEACGGFA